MNIIFNSLLVQLVEYDVHTTRKIKSIHATFYHILLLYCLTSEAGVCVCVNDLLLKQLKHKFGLVCFQKVHAYDNRPLTPA